VKVRIPPEFSRSLLNALLLDLDAGPGFSFPISVGQAHAEISTYLAWAVGREGTPMFIVRGALL
jgi:hypothetical protein